MRVEYSHRGSNWIQACFMKWIGFSSSIPDDHLKVKYMNLIVMLLWAVIDLCRNIDVSILIVFIAGESQCQSRPMYLHDRKSYWNRFKGVINFRVLNLTYWKQLFINERVELCHQIQWTKIENYNWCINWITDYLSFIRGR